MNSSIVSQRRSARGFSAFLMATVSMAVLLPAGAQVASAQERAASVRYAIPAGPLPQALNRFADASGLQLVYDAATTRSLRTGGFSGPGTTADALSGLLAGTGLSYSFTNANTVTITDRVAAAHDGSVAADGSLVLDTISVTPSGTAPIGWTTNTSLDKTKAPRATTDATPRKMRKRFTFAARNRARRAVVHEASRSLGLGA